MAAALKPRGAFVVFEGVDRAGKSTQCKLLAEGLRAKGRDARRRAAFSRVASPNACPRDPSSGRRANARTGRGGRVAADGSRRRRGRGDSARRRDAALSPRRGRERPAAATCGHSVEVSRGDAAAAAWIVRGDGSRRRRGCQPPAASSRVHRQPERPRARRSSSTSQTGRRRSGR